MRLNSSQADHFQDIVTNKCDMSPPDLEAAICAAKDNAREQLLRSQSTSSMPPGALEQLLDTIDPTTLLPEKVATTFWSVRGAGTPMWVIHRRSSGEVLDRRFGQSPVLEEKSEKFCGLSAVDRIELVPTSRWTDTF